MGSVVVVVVDERVDLCLECDDGCRGGLGAGHFFIVCWNRSTLPQGDRSMRSDGQGVAGVVVEPGEDLDVGAVGEVVVGEVGLPRFIGLRG